MRIFSFKESINFIDRYDVFLGYSLHRESSEITGFNVSRDEAVAENLTSNIDDLNEILKGYYFDVNFFKTYIENDEDDPIKCIAMFKLKKKDSEDLYLSVHNAHNGYYFHGFELNKVKIDRNKKIEFFGKEYKEADLSESINDDVEILKMKEYLAGSPVVVKTFFKGKV